MAPAKPTKAGKKKQVKFVIDCWQCVIDLLRVVVGCRRGKSLLCASSIRGVVSSRR